MLRTISLLSIAASLAACGGGGGNGNGGATAPAAEVRPLADITPRLGDFYSYKQIYTAIDPVATSGGPPPNWYTDVVTAVNPDGSWIQDETGEDPAPTRGQDTYLADGENTTWVSGNCITSYARTYSNGKKELVVGASWNTATTTTYSAGCGDYPPGSSTSTSSIMALETVTVPAGAFKTAKMVSHTISTSSSGATTTSDATTWIETSTNRTVKRNVAATQVTTAGRRISYSRATELQGYAQAKTGRALLNVERFAGPWSGTYSGAYSGNCYGQVSLAGVLDAACGGGQFAVHGVIDASGNVAFSLNAGGSSGPVFSGKFESPLRIQGSWSAPGVADGTWQLNHL